MTNILAIIPGYDYNFKLYDFLRITRESSKSPLYVSLNKTYGALVEQFLHDGVDVSKFHFIDGITSSIFNPKKIGNCIFLPTKYNLKMLHSVIINTVNLFHLDTILFNSLSSLLIYYTDEEIVSFVKSLIKSLPATCPIVFICLENDMKSNAITEIRNIVDSIYGVRPYDIQNL